MKNGQSSHKKAQMNLNQSLRGMNFDVNNHLAQRSGMPHNFNTSSSTFATGMNPNQQYVGGNTQNLNQFQNHVINQNAFDSLQQPNADQYSQQQHQLIMQKAHEIFTNKPVYQQQSYQVVNQPIQHMQQHNTNEDMSNLNSRVMEAIKNLQQSQNHNIQHQYQQPQQQPQQMLQQQLQPQTQHQPQMQNMHQNQGNFSQQNLEMNNFQSQEKFQALKQFLKQQQNQANNTNGYDTFLYKFNHLLQNQDLQNLRNQVDLQPQNNMHQNELRQPSQPQMQNSQLHSQALNHGFQTTDNMKQMPEQFQYQMQQQTAGTQDLIRAIQYLQQPSNPPRTATNYQGPLLQNSAQEQQNYEQPQLSREQQNQQDFQLEVNDLIRELASNPMQQESGGMKMLDILSQLRAKVSARQHREPVNQQQLFASQDLQQPQQVQPEVSHQNTESIKSTGDRQANYSHLLANILMNQQNSQGQQISVPLEQATGPAPVPTSSQLPSQPALEQKLMISIPITQNYVSNDTNANMFSNHNQNSATQINLPSQQQETEQSKYYENIQDLVLRKCEQLQNKVTTLIKEKYVSKDQFMNTIMQDNDGLTERFSSKLLQQIASTLEQQPATQPQAAQIAASKPINIIQGPSTGAQQPMGEAQRQQNPIESNKAIEARQSQPLTNQINGGYVVTLPFTGAKDAQALVQQNKDNGEVPQAEAEYEAGAPQPAQPAQDIADSSANFQKANALLQLSDISQQSMKGPSSTGAQLAQELAPQVEHFRALLNAQIAKADCKSIQNSNQQPKESGAPSLDGGKSQDSNKLPSALSAMKDRLQELATALGKREREVNEIRPKSILENPKQKVEEDVVDAFESKRQKVEQNEGRSNAVLTEQEQRAEQLKKQYQQYKQNREHNDKLEFNSMFFPAGNGGSEEEGSAEKTPAPEDKAAERPAERSSGSNSACLVGNKNPRVKLRKRRGKYLNYDQQILFTLRDVLSREQLKQNRDEILEGVLHFMRKAGSQDISAIVLDGSHSQKGNLAAVLGEQQVDEDFRGSKYRGPSKNRSKWQVMKMVNKKTIRIGAINTEEDAARVYDFLSILTQGLQAKTNFSYTIEQVLVILREFYFKDANLLGAEGAGAIPHPLAALSQTMKAESIFDCRSPNFGKETSGDGDEAGMKSFGVLQLDEPRDKQLGSQSLGELTQNYYKDTLDRMLQKSGELQYLVNTTTAQAAQSCDFRKPRNKRKLLSSSPQDDPSLPGFAAANPFGSGQLAYASRRPPGESTSPNKVVLNFEIEPKPAKQATESPLEPSQSAPSGPPALSLDKFPQFQYYNSVDSRPLPLNPALSEQGGDAGKLEANLIAPGLAERTTDQQFKLPLSKAPGRQANPLEKLQGYLAAGGTGPRVAQNVSFLNTISKSTNPGEDQQNN